MAVPNTAEMVVATLESRRKKIEDNVTNNNAILTWLDKEGNVDTTDGGSTILEELSFQANSNFSWFSGAETFTTNAVDVLSAAEFALKQAICTVVVNGLEKLKNSGVEKVIDLVASRLKVAESTIANNISTAIYSDGTGSNGKQITGLQAMCPTDPTTGTYGNINRANYTFWRPYYLAVGAASSTTIQGKMNTAYNSVTRGTDVPKVIVTDATVYGAYEASLQALVRLVDVEKANMGFRGYQYKGATVVLDGGIGGACPANQMFMINPKFVHWRPHVDANFKTLKTRVAINQDAEITPIVWAGNLTCSGNQYQARLSFT